MVQGGLLKSEGNFSRIASYESESNRNKALSRRSNKDLYKQYSSVSNIVRFQALAVQRVFPVPLFN